MSLSRYSSKALLILANTFRRWQVSRGAISYQYLLSFRNFSLQLKFFTLQKYRLPILTAAFEIRWDHKKASRKRHSAYLILLLGLSACQEIPNTVAPTLLRSSHKNCSRNIFLVEGLNSSAQTLQPFREYFSAQGACTFEVQLLDERVHHTPATTEAWRDQVVTLLRREVKPVIPNHIVGYSAGALATILALQHSGFPQELRSAVLIAPPLAFKPWISVFRIFGFPLFLLSETGVAIPSLAPEVFRSTDATSVRSYQALFNAVHQVRARPLNFPADKLLFVLTNHDEFIDYPTSRILLHESFGSRLQLHTITSAPLPGTPGHLIHPWSYGDKVWSQTASLIQRFLTRQEAADRSPTQ